MSLPPLGRHPRRDPTGAPSLGGRGTLSINIAPNYGRQKVVHVQSFIVIQRPFARECLLNYRQPLSTMKHYNPNGQPSGGRSDRRARVGRLAAEWREAAVGRAVGKPHSSHCARDLCSDSGRHCQRRRRRRLWPRSSSYVDLRQRRKIIE